MEKFFALVPLETNQDMKKQSFIQRIFSMPDRNGRENIKETGPGSEETHSDSTFESVFNRGLCLSMPRQHVQSFRVFVATWNVGGKSPHSNFNLDDFLQVHDQSDIYVLGFQEIVPLNAGNVLVIEDNEPAARWLSLINQSLNQSCSLNSRGLTKPATFSPGGSLFFQKPSLKKVSKSFRTESKRRLKTCNCSSPQELLERKFSKELCFRCQQSFVNRDELSSDEDEDGHSTNILTGMSTSMTSNQMKYSLVASKQMVGIFVTVWMKKELVQHVSHLRISSIGRGIMGCLGNKGCISVSMSFYRTSFCFICSHLASGEKEGDELRRNSDVIEILRNTQFSKICRTASSRVPDKILEHE